MNELDQAIKNREEQIERLQSDLQATQTLLETATRELSYLLGARMILNNSSECSLQLNAALPSLPFFHADNAPQMPPSSPPTLVNEVMEVLKKANGLPLGPKEIQDKLACEGRRVEHNVLTGVLSRITKDGRIERLERGKYIKKTGLGI